MAAGEGAGNAKEYVAKMTDAQLQEHSPLYQRMVSAGATPAQAREIVSARAEDASALLQGAVATLGEGIVGGFSFDAVYEKYFLGRVGAFFEDLVTPQDAIITAQINYHTGAAVLSLLYNLKYDGAGGYIVTSSIQSSIKF